MLTHVTIKNFKRFDSVNFELGKTVVLIGPNNCGKSTALQALALWDIGLKQWLAKAKRAKKAPDKRPGVTINRNDLISIPTPSADLLWRDLHTRKGLIIEGKPQTKNIRIDIIVDGESNGRTWRCGLEFDYANPESLYCRPLRLSEDKGSKRMTIPDEDMDVQVAYLPPMSGLAAMEPKWEPGRINVLLGEGQTAQVLRNLCYQIYREHPEYWNKLTENIERLFGMELLEPRYIKERGEITMVYKERSITLDLANSGRGAQQTLLLLAHLYANPNTVLLLDEPDAHLEILRQRQTYQLITEIAEQSGSQIIAASHSEVVLNEAAGRDVVIAFIGEEPHRIDNRGSQVLKSLKEIGFDQYSQAEQTGWVLYLEGSTDLAILRVLAKTLEHDAVEHLERPFVYYVANQPAQAQSHFHGLREAKPDLVGIAIYDRLSQEPQQHPQFKQLMWQKYELENYLCFKGVLLSYAEGKPDLFAQHRRKVMQDSVVKVSDSFQTIKNQDPWSEDTKASDFLEPLFSEYFKKLGLSNQMWKTNYHVLAGLVPAHMIDSDIIEKLDAIVAVARAANPSVDEQQR